MCSPLGFGHRISQRFVTSRLLVAAIVAGALLGWSLARASAAQADCLSPVDAIAPSCFEAGDGNLTADHLGQTDWASLTPMTFTDPTGATDDEFAGGNQGKEQDPGSWALIPGTNQAKADVVAAATGTDPLTGHLFVYGAFERVGTTGNTNLSFELNADPTLWDNDNNPATPPVPTRSEGDLLITFDGGAGSVVVGACVWHGDKYGESADSSYGWYPAPGYGTTSKLAGSDRCTQLSGSVNPSAIGNVNSTTLDNSAPILTNFSPSLAPNSFGEMAVDVSRALASAGTPEPCVDFGSIWLHTRSSDVPTSAMEDYVTPHAISHAATCKISVDKTVAVGSAAGPYHQGTAADPVYANNGNTLYYKLAVKNEGTATVALDSVVDPNCSTPTLSDQKDKNGAADSSPGTFDAGDVWTYTCSHVLGSGDAEPFVNTVTVNGHVGSTNLTATDHADVSRYGAIVITKSNVGGTQTDEFHFTTSSALDSSTTFDLAASDGNKTYANLVTNAGNATVYSVSEDATGQPAGYTLTGLVCRSGMGANDPVDGDTTTSVANHIATITVSPGETVHCTFTNTHETTLTVIKHVVNNNGGGAAAGDFTMNVTATNASETSFAGSEAGHTITLDPGSYSVAESGGPSGYAESDSTDCAGTIAVGQHKTCTITNDDIQPQLTVIKHVINDDGGTKTAANFTMNVTGPSATPSSFPGAESPGTDVALNAGSYSVDENADSGYTKTLGTDCSGTIAVGQTKTCTITNNDKAATLHVIKHVINDNGGQKTAGDFTLNVTGSSASPSSFPGAESPGTTVSLHAGSYSVDENADSGYAKSLSADCSGTIANGETKTCTITNNDKAAHLNVIKHVINDNGGQKSAGDFTLNVTGGSASPASFPGDESGTSVTLDAGSYSVDENADSGYAKSLSANCSGTIANGETKTCTVTNDDKAAHLTVIKHVIGGTKTAGDFTLNVTGAGASPASFPGDESGTSVTLDAGSYSVGEGSHTDYTEADSADCSGTIANGESKTCTITNTRDTGTIEIVKHLVPSSDTGVFDLNVDGGAAEATDVGNNGTTGAVTVDTGANHSVSESAGTGTDGTYYRSAYSCTRNGGDPFASGSGTSLGSITVNKGDAVVCTFTNTRLNPSVLVIKAGNTYAYHGDTLTYSFTVSNTGNSPLHDVHVSDDKCPNVSATPTSKVNDDGNDTLDSVGADGVNPEQWIFTCSMPVPDHTATEVNPIVNTATASATDENGHQVQGTAQHSTLILHPGVSITKTGPAAATAGDLVSYDLAVTNTGDEAFADPLVRVSDDLCEAPPALKSKNADLSPATLDPGETWIYTCSVQTQLGQTSVHNTGTVDATDPHGKHVGASSAADTVLAAPRAAVLPATVKSGRASLRGPTGCAARHSALATVNGEQVQSVTFYLDGRKVKTLTAPNNGKRYSYRVQPRKLRFGIHRITAKIVFLTASDTKPKTLKLAFTRCRPAIVKPEFTG